MSILLRHIAVYDQSCIDGFKFTANKLIDNKTAHKQSNTQFTSYNSPFHVIDLPLY